MGYDLYCDFDIDKHKETYINYLEVIITGDGVIHYAVPSHQEYMIRLAMDMNNWSRKELIDSIPDDYLGDVIIWLSKVTNSVSVWNTFIEFYWINDAQLKSIKNLYGAGLYSGPVPCRPMGFEDWRYERFSIESNELP